MIVPGVYAGRARLASRPIHAARTRPIRGLLSAALCGVVLTTPARVVQGFDTDDSDACAACVRLARGGAS